MTHLSNTAINQIKAAIYSYQNSFIKSDTNVLAGVVTVVVMSTCFPYQDALIHDEIAKCKIAVFDKNKFIDF